MRPAKVQFVIVFAVWFLATGLLSPVSAVDQQVLPLDFVIKISRIAEKQKLMAAMADDGRFQADAPAALIAQMLYGTEWIDPDRAIVIGGIMHGDRSEVGAWVPFQNPNPEFKTAYHAVEGPDYYVLHISTDEKQKTVSEDLVGALMRSSEAEIGDFVSLSLAIRRILQKGDKKTREMIGALLEPSKGFSGSQMEISPEEKRTAVADFVKTASQMDVLTQGIDFNQDAFRFSSRLTALQDSDLFWIFSRNNDTRFLDTYTPDRQINFRTGQYDIAGLFKLIHEGFGPFYRQKGIDTESLSKLSGYFSGEMAGGMDLSRTGTKFELICVLKKKKLDKNFIEKIYLPWLKILMDEMNTAYKNNNPDAGESMFLRMPDTIVAGHPAVGGMLQIPMIHDIAKIPSGSSRPAMGQVFFRMARVNNFLLFAPDDHRLEELIAEARTFQEKPDQTPFMTAEIDMDAYLKAVTDDFKTLPNRNDLPIIGKIAWVTDLSDGAMTTRSSLEFGKIKALLAVYQALSAPSRTRLTIAEPHRTRQKDKPQVDETKPKAMPDEENPAYWANKAGLSATYGNNTQAVNYYAKALSLAPGKSDYYYFMGISYGELGKIQEAIAAMNEAIRIDTANARYYYGRGRVYLMTGNQEAAMQDMRSAAALGDRDAYNYLIQTHKTD